MSEELKPEERYIKAWREEQTQSIHEKFGPTTTAWSVRSEWIFRVWIGDDCRGFPYHSTAECKYSQETETLVIDFAAGALIVTGPKAWDFYSGFCTQSVTELLEDGVDIVRISFVLRQ